MQKEKNRLFQASTILFIINLSASALNYLCQLVMARFFSVESYGTINTIFSFMMITAVPGTTLTMIVAKYYASTNSAACKHSYLKKQLHVVAIMTIVVFIFMFACQKELSKILLIHDNFVLISALILAALGYFQPLYSGVFSGNKYFILVGIYSLFIPLYKLFAVGIAYLVSSADIIRLYVLLLIMFLGVIGTAIWGQKKASDIVGTPKKPGGFDGILYSKNDFNTLVLNMSLMLYMNIDLLSVRYYGNETESGLYSSVLLFGRVIYYFSTTLGTILLPSVADYKSNDKDRRNTLNRTLILMIFFAIICMIPINIWGKLFIQILYGSEYLPASKYIIFVSIISLSLSIYTIMINYAVGIGKTKMTTIIMIIIDILLVTSVLLLQDVVVILLSLSCVGLLGAITIYLLNISMR